ncbi:MAG: 5'/3'-nucleotidase SurE [Actinomycetota bacterium]|nr:5'/3'-nucleotidase SurE [Actinomycetota bacterium]
MTMLALVTNDDGVDSDGIRTLAHVARAAGLDVVVAAPGWDASGAGASITAVEEGGRFRVEQRVWGDGRIGTVFAVEASPAFIVRAALGGAFGAPPDLVLSGINHGPNTGRAVLHSGTVGAALTGSVHGLRAMAVSMSVGPDMHWETAAHIAGIALQWLLGSEDAQMLNVNVPNVSRERLGGFRRARLAAVGAVQSTVTEADQGYMKIAYHDADADQEPGTDAALLAAGIACFTPLQATCEAQEVDTQGLGAAKGRG